MKSLVALAALLAILAACNREDGKGGPAERAGRQVDKAMDKAGQAVEQAGRDMQKSSKGENSQAGK
ncbi:MAG TPA: hypothetical protein VFJ70_24110 [Burkholderiales bacterium]|nr:hypothetical protein [Burkholderiales bacterium]